jgi:hypothetical protein
MRQQPKAYSDHWSTLLTGIFVSKQGFSNSSLTLYETLHMSKAWFVPCDRAESKLQTHELRLAKLRDRIVGTPREFWPQACPGRQCVPPPPIAMVRAQGCTPFEEPNWTRICEAEASLCDVGNRGIRADRCWRCEFRPARNGVRYLLRAYKVR